MQGGRKFLAVKLNPGVVLSWRDGEDCMLGLFPQDRDPIDHGIGDRATSDDVPF